MSTVKILESARLNESLRQLIDLATEVTTLGHTHPRCPVYKGVIKKDVNAMGYAKCNCDMVDQVFWQIGQYTARIAYYTIYFQEMLPHAIKPILSVLKEELERHKFSELYNTRLVRAISLLNIIQQELDRI
jgi:hypothetical protein